MTGEILYQFVGSPRNPLTEGTVKKFLEFSKISVNTFMSYDRKAFIKDPNYAKKIK
jgi:hypothetical protein